MRFFIFYILIKADIPLIDTCFQLVVLYNLRSVFFPQDIAKFPVDNKCSVSWYPGRFILKENMFFENYLYRFRFVPFFGNISQLDTRPLIGWPSGTTNQRPGFQLTYVSKTLLLPKHLHLIHPVMWCFRKILQTIWIKIDSEKLLFFFCNCTNPEGGLIWYFTR